MSRHHERHYSRPHGVWALAALAAALAVCSWCRSSAHAQSGGTIERVGYLDVPNSRFNTDVWGWVDPKTGTEYALVGNNATGLHIVDVSDPTAPVIVSTVDTVPRFDIKTWKHYAYSVDGNYAFAGSDGKILDIADPENPAVVGSFPPGHNIFIDGQGFMYLAFPGLKIYDLNGDPANPELVWSKTSTQGHDATVVGDRLYDFHGLDGTFIYDVSDRANPILRGHINDPDIIFHHSGWTSWDGDYLFLNDELAEHPSPDITIWDIRDPSVPVKVAEIADSTATVHNCYRIGWYLYVAYYTAGFRVYDISDPTRPVLADEYDTTDLTGEGLFQGAWGCYPFVPSGNIYVNDRPNGLFIFTFSPAPRSGPVPFVLRPSFPNPFGPSTTVAYELLGGGRVTVVVYDVAGRPIRTIVDTDQTAGPYSFQWDGKNGSGQRVGSGVYFCRLQALGHSSTIKMTLVE